MISNKIKFISFIFIFCLLFQANGFAQFELQNSVIGIGGSVSSDSAFNLIGIAGQPFVGNSENLSFITKSGFSHSTASIIAGLAEPLDLIPGQFQLYQNYPNPFNPITKIKFSVPEQSQIKLEIYNVLGQQVALLVNKEMEPGYKIIEFDASNLASGFYFYRLQADGFQLHKKMVLMK